VNDLENAINQLAEGSIDESIFYRIVAEHLATVPDDVFEIQRAIQHAERAGKIKLSDIQSVRSFLESAATAATRFRSSASLNPDDMTARRLPEEILPLTGESVAMQAVVAEGFVLKNRYQLIKRIGTGGMGVVYRAKDLDYQRVSGEEQIIAIKVLRPEFREHPDSVKSLFEEVRKTRDLAHPNIVGVFNCEQDGDVVFMTMQYLEGKTMEALLSEDFARGLPWERARPIIEESATPLHMRMTVASFTVI
jgi:hypothetical protein